MKWKLNDHDDDDDDDEWLDHQSLFFLLGYMCVFVCFINYFFFVAASWFNLFYHFSFGRPTRTNKQEELE